MAILFCAAAVAEEPPTPLGTPPTGFDVRRTGVPAGKVETVEYDSKAAGTKRKLMVHLPAGHDPAAAKPLPVLYLLHGGGGDETHWTRLGAAADILDNLLADSKIEPMAVVMPSCRLVKPGAAPANMFAGYDEFRDDLLGDIMPLVEARFRVRKEREGRALAGLSMGGLQTLDIGLTNLDKFSALGVFSSGWFPDRREKFVKDHGAILSDPETNRRLKLFWIANSKRDIAYQNNMAMLKLFDERGLKYQYREGQGGHDFKSWRNHLWEFAPLLFREAK
jgi:enterochelin esterase family protein